MRKVTVFCTALGTLALSVVSAMALADSTDTRCVQFGQDKHLDKQRIDFHLENSCAKTAVCSISWEVTCDSARAKNDESATLSPSASQTFHASAAYCDGRWNIGTPIWSCKLQE